MTKPYIYLSPPHVGPRERELLLEAFDSNWIAPLGPMVNAFEAAFAQRVGAPEAAALSSGTAALHLSLLLLGVGPGDLVLTSTLTFAATANAIRYVGAEPIFLDSERTSWNLDPDCLEQALIELRRENKRPAAVVAVDLYGQCADYSRIVALCAEHEVPLIEDAAEALGASHELGPAGSFGDFSIFSFNGNKIITTSGGGMLVAKDPAKVQRARWLAAQAREPTPHYEHVSVGYNYRLSNLLAAVGLGQLEALDDRVAARRETNRHYRELLGDLPGVEFAPPAPWGEPSYWLTTLTLAPELPVDREQIRLHLQAEAIESRPIWKPMHMQPVFSQCRMFGGAVTEDIFARGLCLPSGSSLSPADRLRVAEAFRAALSREPTA